MNDSFLPLSEAAERLGQSRLKLREAIARGIVPATRDNEGQWRIDLSAVPADLRPAKAGPADPAALMDALFDEIADLMAEADQAQGTNRQLALLAERQGALLDRATAALDRVSAERDSLAGIAGRAITAAEEAEDRAARLRAVADRTMALLDQATSAIEGMQAETAALRADAAAKDDAIAGHAARLDRLFALSEQALERATQARRGPGLLARVFGARRD